MENKYCQAATNAIVNRLNEMNESLESVKQTGILLPSSINETNIGKIRFMYDNSIYDKLLEFLCMDEVDMIKATNTEYLKIKYQNG